MTIRGKLEAILRVAEGAPDEDHHACDIYELASAALTDLNNARVQKAPPAFYKDDGGIRYRLIPDPEEPHGHPTHRAE